MLTDLFSFAEESGRFSLVKSFCFDAQFLLVSLNSQDIYQFISLITFSIYFKVIKENGGRLENVQYLQAFATQVRYEYASSPTQISIKS